MDSLPIQFYVETSSIGNVGKLVFNMPNDKFNKLNLQTLDNLSQILDSISSRIELKALLITSEKPNMFLVGADLRELLKGFQDSNFMEDLIAKGKTVIKKIQDLPYPTIAVINGVCHGGGLELALACTYRIASDNPKATFGFPETSLGYTPAWGGSQRLPRLVGLSAGLRMLISGKTIPSKEALQIHLIDAIMPTPFVEENTQEFLFNLCDPDKSRKIRSARNQFNSLRFIKEDNPLGRKILFYQMEKEIDAETKQHYPASMIALNLVRDTYLLPINEGMEKETEVFLSNINTHFSNAPNLINAFYSHESLKKNQFGINSEIIPILSTAVIEAGDTENYVAWVFANNNINVRLKNTDWESLGKSSAAIHQLFNQAKKQKKLTSDAANLKSHQISYTIDYSGFQNVDLAFETAKENLQLKQQLLNEIEDNVPEETIIASNASFLTIKELSQGMKHPERMIGMHFFDPAPRMPLVEIIAGEKTALKTIASAIKFCQQIGKVPLLVKDSPGFLVNRILTRGINEAMWMLQEGLPFRQIEKVFTDFGFPFTPFLLSDQKGIDLAYKTSRAFEKAYGERMQSPEILDLIYNKGWFGKQVLKGFYLYDKKHPTFNPEISECIKLFNPEKQIQSDAFLQDRVLLAMINEAALCLEENVVSSPDYLDIALLLGIGFPPFRGGLLKYADQFGILSIINLLKSFEKIYGPRYTPAPLLEKLKSEKQLFYPQKSP